MAAPAPTLRLLRFSRDTRFKGEPWPPLPPSMAARCPMTHTWPVDDNTGPGCHAQPQRIAWRLFLTMENPRQRQHSAEVGKAEISQSVVQNMRLTAHGGEVSAKSTFPRLLLFVRRAVAFTPGVQRQWPPQSAVSCTSWQLLQAWQLCHLAQPRSHAL